VSWYEGKVNGITSTTVLDMIKGLQPYNFPDPIGSPLFIIHKMDITDKHQKLVLFSPIGGLEWPIDVAERYVRYQRGDLGSMPIDIESEFKSRGKIVPQVAFRNFGKREIEPVVSGLAELQNFVVDLVKRFSRHLESK
jgi:hypothetical protein